MHFHGRMQGFSIIELLAVMAAIGILIAIVFPTYTEMVDDKKEMKAKSLLFEIMHLEEEYYSEQKVYTLDLASLGYIAEDHEYAEDYRVSAMQCNGLDIANCVLLHAESLKDNTRDFQMRSNSDRIMAVD
ncbi:MAG TPA: hypothetical protein DHW71_09735 [Gammaproteobacteria bacterium]|nr:hypothetical protein [Gammaproteobacteria bacterium]MEC8011602.1 prepilin-type N-terminal cleavage/methylation domain-containing protein [Pseudomonadota bacterium]HBF07850.1 hypothetical protein [Gammaproteobacteria bacterium]HCK93257.1 hypothetical protein [Gammaproteobacteria bacterium]|tara:strand:+ start:537 stop:926 length:390 start_codon:yes stop_codon:yes gene_type:complete